MAFNKDEIKQLKELFKDNNKIILNHVDQKFNESKSYTDEKMEWLARITVEEFNRMHKILEQHNKAIKDIKREQLSHDFKMTEMVHKSDHFQLEERVHNIETKLKMA